MKKIILLGGLFFLLALLPGCGKLAKNPVLKVHTELHGTGGTFTTSGVLIEVYDYDTQKLVNRKVTDDDGNAEIVLKPGIYDVSATYETGNKIYAGTLPGWVELEKKEVKEVSIDLY